METPFKTTLTNNSRLADIDFNNLGFGDDFCDHMFSMEYAGGKWHTHQIMPYQPITLAPGCLTLHYGQTVFEGLKAFRGVDGRFRVFRPDMNAKRLHESCLRLCMPTIDDDVFMNAIEQLVQVDHAWVPEERGQAFYIRPLLFATEPHLNVRAATEYRFLMMTAPVCEYFSRQVGGVKLKAEDKYTRAAPGGMGYAKTAGNYAASLRPGKESMDDGFDQILWLDGHEHKFVEEVGQMNIFFKIAGKVLTPPLKGTILPGVTRNSVLALLKDKGVDVEERPIHIEEVLNASDNHTLEEVFGAGTAAVIAPVKSITYGDRIANAKVEGDDLFSGWLYKTILDIQTGASEDTYGWNMTVDVSGTESKSLAG